MKDIKENSGTIHFPKGEGIKIIQQVSEAKVPDTIYIRAIDSLNAELIVVSVSGAKRRVGIMALPEGDDGQIYEIDNTVDEGVRPTNRLYEVESLAQFLKDALDKEVIARIAGDHNLQRLLDLEKSERQEADAKKLDKPTEDGVWVVKKEAEGIVYVGIESEELDGVRDKYVQFEQIFPAKEWTILHNMGKNPSVTTTDTAGTVMKGSVKYSPDKNSLTVHFNYPVSGKAELN